MALSPPISPRKVGAKIVLKILTEVCTKINNKLIAMLRLLRRMLCVIFMLDVVSLVLWSPLLGGNRTGAVPWSRALHISVSGMGMRSKNADFRDRVKNKINKRGLEVSHGHFTTPRSITTTREEFEFKSLSFPSTQSSA